MEETRVGPKPRWVASASNKSVWSGSASDSNEKKGLGRHMDGAAHSRAGQPQGRRLAVAQPQGLARLPALAALLESAEILVNLQKLIYAAAKTTHVHCNMEHTWNIPVLRTSHHSKSTQLADQLKLLQQLFSGMDPASNFDSAGKASDFEAIHTGTNNCTSLQVAVSA